jgi:hypothetical protein
MGRKITNSYGIYSNKDHQHLPNSPTIIEDLSTEVTIACNMAFPGLVIDKGEIVAHQAGDGFLGVEMGSLASENSQFWG